MTSYTIPETFYFPTWTVSERVNDMWTVNGERTQNASGAQTRALSERWTQGERKMNDLFEKPRVFSSALSIL